MISAGRASGAKKEIASNIIQFGFKACVLKIWRKTIAIPKNVAMSTYNGVDLYK